MVLNYEDLLSQLPFDKLAQLVAIVHNADKSNVLAELRKLLIKFFPAYQGRINFDDLATNLLNHLNNLLPSLSETVFGSLCDKYAS